MKHIFKFILLTINIVAACALLFSGYGGHFDPASSSLPGIALMLFPAILTVVIVLILLDLLMWRRLAFLPAFAMLASAAPIWNFCPLNFGSNKLPDGYKEIKLLTYNTYNFNYVSNIDSVNRAANTILATDADIVCIQEALATDPSEWDNVRVQADSITTRYPYRLHGPSSLAIWSRYPIDSISINQPSDPSGMFQCVKADIDGTPLILYNIHLQSIRLSNDDKALYGSLTRRPTTHKLENARYGMIAKLSAAMKERSIQAKMLRHAIDSIGGSNIIVAGDFNDIEDCHAQRVIEGSNLKSTFTTVGFGPTVTYYANRFYFNIDHILYGGDIKAIDYKCLRSRASDHYPVTGTFALSRPKNAL